MGRLLKFICLWFGSLAALWLCIWRRKKKTNLTCCGAFACENKNTGWCFNDVNFCVVLALPRMNPKGQSIRNSWWVWDFGARRCFLTLEPSRMQANWASRWPCCLTLLSVFKDILKTRRFGKTKIVSDFPTNLLAGFWWEILALACDKNYPQRTLTFAFRSYFPPHSLCVWERRICNHLLYSFCLD